MRVSFHRFYCYFTKANVVNMNDYTCKMQFYYLNEVLVQTEWGNLDFFHHFLVKISENSPWPKSLNNGKYLPCNSVRLLILSD